MSAPSKSRVLLVGLCLAGLLGLAIGARIAYQIHVPRPRFPLKLPDSVSWANRSRTIMPDGTERIFTEAFVAEGARFRLEVARPGQPAVVWVYDGQSLAVSAGVPERAPAEIDPRNTILGAYATLPGFELLGVRKVGDHRCWAFSKDEEALTSRFWVDVVEQVPRQIAITYRDGRKDVQTYADLPLHRTRQPDLFEPDNLDAVLITGAEAMFGS